MAVVKTGNTENLVYTVVGNFQEIKSEFESKATSVKQFIQATQALPFDPADPPSYQVKVTSSAPTKLVATVTASEEDLNLGPVSYKDTITLVGGALPTNLVGSNLVLPYISSVNDTGTGKSVNDMGVTTSSATYSSLSNVYINPTTLTNELATITVYSNTDKESGFYFDESGVKVTYSYANSYEGDVSVNVSGDDSSSYTVNGLITKISSSYSFKGTGFSNVGSFSFTSVDGFGYGFGSDFNFSGNVANLQFANTQSFTEGGVTFSGTDSYLAKGNNDFLADVLTAYIGGLATVDDVAAALLFDNDVITGRDIVLASDNLFGYDGNDKIDGLKGDDSLDGGNGNDTLNGGDGIDFISGDNGNDSIAGGVGDDFLEGGAGRDIIKGDAGIDLIIGGAGVDTLTGGLGFDTFQFAVFMEGSEGFIPGDSGTSTLTMDRILDFKTGDDLIVIDLGRAALGDNSIESTTIAANYGQARSIANAYFAGDLETSDAAYFISDKLNGYLFVDSDNNGAADLAITLVGINTAAEFNVNDVSFVNYAG